MSPAATSGCEAPFESQPRVGATGPEMACWFGPAQLVLYGSALTSFGAIRGAQSVPVGTPNPSAAGGASPSRERPKIWPIWKVSLPAPPSSVVTALLSSDAK